MRSERAAIILAAGKGSRMKSSLPKVLHPLAGLPLVVHVVRAAQKRQCSPIVMVVSKDSEALRAEVLRWCPDAPIRFATQALQRGTGDAVKSGLAELKGFRGGVLILSGDAPLMSHQTLARLERGLKNKKVVVLSAVVDDPFGYGRVVRENAKVVGIVEQKDGSAEILKISEINSGTYACDADFLRASVNDLKANNAQGEFYLTDIVAQAAQSRDAAAVVAHDARETMGINTRAQLSKVETHYLDLWVARHQELGVHMRRPSSLVVDAQVVVKPGATLGVGVQLFGNTVIEAGATVEGPSVLVDSLIKKNALVHAFSHLEKAEVGSDSNVGPYARLRPGAVLSKSSKVGNFVELKNTTMGAGAKAGHLAYLGDTDVGAGVNVGAGTITCNYDGFLKHKTKLGKNTFVGSNSTLIAPVTLGANAYVAAGSTITQDVPKDALAFGRSRQSTKAGYGEHIRKRLKQAKEKKDTK